MDNARHLLSANTLIEFTNSSIDAVKNSDALIIVTEWDEFRGVEKKEILAQMKGNVIIDGRNIWNCSDFTELNAIYEPI